MKTKGDGMERRAERHICGTNGDSYQFQHEIKSLTRLLRKVAREAEKREREACAKIVCCFCKEGLPIILSGTAKVEAHPGKNGVNLPCGSTAIRNRRSA